MATYVSFVGLLVLLLSGFTLLALSQDQHRRTIGVPLLKRCKRAGQRLVGYVVLALALPLAISRDGPGFGTLLWAVLLSVAAYAVTFTLSWKPRWFAWSPAGAAHETPCQASPIAMCSRNRKPIQ